jgi:putative ABC transport system substrate-binding protein
MKRREFTVGLALGPLAAALLAQAQQTGKSWKIGILHVGDHVPRALDTLRNSLKSMGYEEGRNLHLDFRNFTEEQAARDAAADFVRARIDLLVAFGPPAIRAAQAATSQIPIVFVRAFDPVALGFVSSLARPGGNLTGLAGGGVDIPAKQLEIYRELVPRLRRILVLSDPNDPATPRILAEVERASVTLKLGLVGREAHTVDDLERVFASLRGGEIDGVFVASPNLHVKFSERLIRLAEAKRLPFLAHRKEWVERGALSSYAPDFRGAGTDAARFVDRILKGAKPADIPVELPMRYELVINLKTAKALGITIPQAVLLRADRVIE